MQYQIRKSITFLINFTIIFFTTQSLYAQCHIDDWTALKALYEKTDSENWIDNTGWEIVKGNNPPINCDLNNLFGVELNGNNRIENISLDNNQLTGSLPEEMGTLLTNLKRLSLHNNQINGLIPGTFGNFKELIKLILSKNQLSGKIPSQLGNLTNLKYLGLGFNQFESKIPWQLGDLRNLIQLAISNNPGLYGKIPIELSNISQLKTLSLAACNLTGSIPAQLGQLNNLEKLILSNNQLIGSIPSELSNLSSLTELNLAWNKLIGDIPTSLNELNNLTILKLSGNQLSGNIPASFGDLVQLTDLSLAYNNLNKDIPLDLGKLNKLTTLKLEWNQLTGSIPPQLTSLNNLTCLDVRNNKLGGCYANELSSLCTQLNPSLNNNISDGNYFTATWQNFCSSDEGSCQVNQNQQVNNLTTNYSGDVTATVQLNKNNIYTLKNSYVEVIDYSICSEINNSSCSTVTGTNNYAANEVLWATEKAVDLLSTEYQIDLAPIESFVNGSFRNNPNKSVFNSEINKIIYGKGDGLARKSLTTPDIVGHEYMHYIIKHFKKLPYYGESGALQESFADIFGEVLEYFCYNGKNDWIFGSQVMINKTGIRSLKNPKDVAMVYQQPNTYKGTYWFEIDDFCLPDDYCGVHTNSGVQNYWFYLLANGGNGTNDNGESYNIKGIGMEKAAQIALNSLFRDLEPNATYKDMMFSSIQTAKSLYGENTNEVEQTVNAWFAVGLYDINPITWQAVNFNQTGPPVTNANDGLTRIPMQFDLALDSLGKNIIADELSFTLHTPETYEILEIQPIAPLTDNEVAIEEKENALKVHIDRVDNALSEKLPSNQPTFRVTACIVALIIEGEKTTLKNPYISGGTQVAPGYFVPHATIPLILGDVENDPNSANQLNLSIGLTNQSCGTLASIRIEVLNYNASANSAINYYLRNASGELVDSHFATPRTFHQFYNLPFGNYEIYVEDQAANYTTQNIKIDFVADLDGSNCCPVDLKIPPGEIQGNFNALETVSIDIGADIKQGTIILICDE